MRVLVTGSCGFVMSVLVRRLLDADPDIQVTAVDLAEPDEVFLSSLGHDRDRVRYRQANLVDAGMVAEIVTDTRPDVVVHAATLTHVPSWEKEDPARYLEVNIGGTANLLEACRITPSIRRIVHVSSGAVYGAGEGIPNPVTEASPLPANELYGITKVSTEKIVHRYGELFGWETPTVRLTKIFGEMERPSSARASMSLPFHLAASAVSGVPVHITERTLNAGGDWLSAVDVAEVLVSLCLGNAAVSTTWNLAGGQWTTVSDLVALFGASIRTAELTGMSTSGAGAGSVGDTVDIDPSLTRGKDGVLDYSKAHADLAWEPRPLQEQVDEYLEWARSNPTIFRTHSSDKE